MPVSPRREAAPTDVKRVSIGYDNLVLREAGEKMAEGLTPGAGSAGEISIPVRGRFVFSDYMAFRKAVELALVDKPKRLTIDLAQCEFIDSAALGMLLLARDEAAKVKTEVCIFKAHGQVERVLEVARFSSLFKFEQ